MLVCTPAILTCYARRIALPVSAAISGWLVQEMIIEDPDNEFDTDLDPKHTDGPRVINVGIPGPGAHVPLWKRAWRDKILPAVARFKPDIIFISAGFDAHRKDDINFRLECCLLLQMRFQSLAHTASGLGL